jgi:hypothetical protein
VEEANEGLTPTFAANHSASVDVKAFANNLRD